MNRSDVAADSVEGDASEGREASERDEPQPAGDTDLLDPRWPIEAARGADAKSAADVVVLRVGDVLAITDFFVIASAPNARLVKAVVEDVEERIAQAGGPRPTRIEGLGALDWVLMDYATFVVHVFQQETRDYYELERLWSDVTSIDWTEPRAAGDSHGAAPPPG